jgi:hypothetical protein
MKKLVRYKTEPTRRTPRILLESGRIVIMGRSIPVNPGEFYRPVMDWISEYIKTGREHTTFEFGFEYINTSSTKWIYNIIKEISKGKETAKRAKIVWYYEKGDEDMCELGFILRSFVECPFHVVEVEGLKKSPADLGVRNAG